EYARSASQRRKLGRRRVAMELLQKGVDRDTVDEAMEEFYQSRDDLSAARQWIEKKTPSMRRLDAPTARRRLTGQLLRRGFAYGAIKPLLDEFFHDDGPEP